MGNTMKHYCWQKQVIDFKVRQLRERLSLRKPWQKKEANEMVSVAGNCLV